MDLASGIAAIGWNRTIGWYPNPKKKTGVGGVGIAFVGSGNFLRWWKLILSNRAQQSRNPGGDIYHHGNGNLGQPES